MVRRYLRSHRIQAPHFTDKGLGRLATFTDEEAGRRVAGAPRGSQSASSHSGVFAPSKEQVHDYKPGLLAPSPRPTTTVSSFRAGSLTWGSWQDFDPDNVCSCTDIFLR